MMSNKEVKFFQMDWWQVVVKQANKYVVDLISSSVTIIVAWILIVLIAMYLMYSQAWRVLTGDLTLPAGVVPGQLSVDTELLQKINQQREDRLNYKVPFFRIEDILR
jgi:hypothetical protein